MAVAIILVYNLLVPIDYDSSDATKRVCPVRVPPSSIPPASACDHLLRACLLGDRLLSHNHQPTSRGSFRRQPPPAEFLRYGFELASWLAMAGLLAGLPIGLHGLSSQARMFPRASQAPDTLSFHASPSPSEMWFKREFVECWFLDLFFKWRG